MQFTKILGIDISKRTIDVALSSGGCNSPMINHQFSNNLKGFRELLSWLKQQKTNLKELLVCMENTGVYHRKFSCFSTIKKSFYLGGDSRGN